MKHSFHLPALLVILLLAAFAQSGCKENVLIDSEVSPSDNTLGIFDTSLGCITHTYYDDTAITGIYIANFPVYQGVGALTDPFFGTMSGATNFQVQPFNANILVYQDKTIDSAVLVLPYSGVTYGDTTDQSLTQSYQAFFLNEDITFNTLYYSYTTRHIDIANPLSDPTTVNLYHLKDSISVKNVKYHPGLRMKLKLPALLNRLMPALTLASNNATPNAAFHSIFKGVCVRVADTRQSTKAYPFFRLDGTDGSNDYSGAGIIVYYHANATPGIDTLTEHYYFAGESCGFFNGVTRSYSHFPVNELYTSIRPNDSIVGLQNQPGASIDIVIPGIKSLPAGLINKAELQLTILPSHNQGKFTPVTRLFPVRVNNGTYPAGVAAGSVSRVFDWDPATSLSAILNGKLQKFNRNGTEVQTYTIGLPREIMASIAAKNDTLHLHISGTQDFIGTNRVIVGGGNHPNPIYRAKLFVVYSVLN